MDSELEHLGRKLKQAQYRQHRAADTALAAIGTTLVQWDALRAIGATPGASGHNLATTTFQTDQSFGTLAQRLEAQGLIERHQGEGRRIGHWLSAAGQQMLIAANDISDRVRKELYAPLSPDDRQILSHILDMLLGESVAPPPATDKKGRPKATL